MKIRPIRVEGEVAFVPLTQGYEAVIDAADVHLVDRWNWSAKVNPRGVYAVRVQKSQQKSRSVYIHRLLMSEPTGFQVDHRDANGLNNRRSNLRLASQAQNNCNKRLRNDSTSGLKGVTWHKRAAKWQAKIQAGLICKYLGLFHSAEAAHAAYQAASADLHGEFGRVA